jgi:hypothetical protein
VLELRNTPMIEGDEFLKVTTVANNWDGIVGCRPIAVIRIYILK